MIYGSMKMRKLIFISLSIILSSLTIGFALVGEDLSLLLPQADELEQWKVAGEPLIYKGENLYDFIDGGAEIFLEYGFSQVISQEYQFGENTLIANIYQMTDSESAFGIFSNNSSPRFKSLTLGNGGFQTDYSVNFWQAEYFVVVESFQTGPSISEALLKFAKSISKRIIRKAEAIEALSHLPDESLIPSTLKLVKGILGINNTYYFSEKDIFQLRENGIGLFADYKINGQKIKLFLSKYKSANAANSAFLRVKEFFNSNPDYEALESVQGILCWRKGEHYFSANNKGSLLGIALEARNKKSSLDLLRLLE